MTPKTTLEDLLGRFVEHHVLHGERLPLDDLCEGHEELREPLAQCMRSYLSLTRTLDRGPGYKEPAAGRPDDGLPRFEGFRTIETLGNGGMGEVYKLHDLTLDRVVAAKVLRPDLNLGGRFADYLREARSMALFQDPRIVQIFEYRDDADPPVIIMEYVDGFSLERLGPSLEYAQRARIFIEICEALHRAHLLGLQHRDLKPSNILLDAGLSPKILDFGLSGGDPTRGHFRGTLPYIAPEQLDASRRIDARTDVYALGVSLYEVLCGSLPYQGETMEDVVAEIKRAQPRLPVEVDPEAPEPLQAIALKAMEKDPKDRYPSAREMALDLQRFLEGRPVLARPTQYVTALGRRLRPHLDQIEEWLRLKLIYPHEAVKLQGAYRHLEAREDDWIVESRTLSYSQITLYLGAFLVVAGSIIYFVAHRFFDAVKGIVPPLLTFGLPFVGLSWAAQKLYRREHKAVAVAYFLGGVLLLPLALLIVFHEAGLWPVPADPAGQFLPEGSISNRQLQVALLSGWAWAFWLALRTRTAALSTVFAAMTILLGLSVLADFGLREWIEKELWDRLAIHLLLLLAVNAAFGYALERRRRPWFGRPLYFGATGLLVAATELLALKGRTFHYLGISMAGFQSPNVNDPLLLDTLAAMSLNGLVFYALGCLMESRGTDLMKSTAWALFAISPFATLEPIGYLNHTGEYSRRFDWIYLALALVIAVLSHHRQRKSFYFAGLINTGWALWMITEHYEWHDEPAWAVTVISVGLAVFLVGFELDLRERLLRRMGR